MRQIHRKDGGTRLRESEIRREIGARSRMRLNIRVFRAEELLRAFDGERLDLVDDLISCVVALARIPLGILVRESGTESLAHGGRNDVFARDKFESCFLSRRLLGDELRDLRVGMCGKFRRHGEKKNPVASSVRRPGAA